jgi:ABC-type nickel/cobalt efflux system permease component RcnA
MTRALTTVFTIPLLALTRAAFAQGSPQPFRVGGGEGGGGGDGGVTGWLMAEQSRLTHVIAAHLHALHTSPSAYWGLIGFGLAYGVFHAAGPGHGKALIATYMLANGRSLRRGAVMALLAALLQALVAIALVGAAAFVFDATASEMNRAADWMEFASYCGIAAIGLWLAWRKGRALSAALGRHFDRSRALATSPAYAGFDWNAPVLAMPSASFMAAAPGAVAGSNGCGHAHAPDPAALGEALSWRDAAGTVIAAGMRPCSGAILVLVFALTQGLFAAGVAATFAMALGTAVTTGALAFLAVFAKSLAMRLAAGEDSRLTLVARGFEFVAALGVLAFGVTLLFGARGGA